MRTPVLFLLVALVLAACGSDRRAPASERGASPASRGPDAVVVRVPRAGGRAVAYVYPNLDSAVWRSAADVPALDRVLGFDGESGLLATVDAQGIPTRVDLRLGTVQRASKSPLSSAASSDGIAIFGVAPGGAITRLTPSGGDWSVPPRGDVLALLPQRDGALLVAARRGAQAVVWRYRPPTTRAGDSAIVDDAGRVVSAQGGDRIYFAAGRDLAGVQTRDLRALDAVRFDAPVHAMAATPSGDRFYASLEGEDGIRVLDRYSNAVAGTVETPGPVSDLRIDPLGRYVLARAAHGDSAWVVAIGTDKVVGAVPTEWRADLPLVLPDGAILTAVGGDVVVRDGTSLGVRRTITGGAADLWHVVRWNGFRPRAAGLDKPVEFQTAEPADSLTDSSGVAPDTGRAKADTTLPPARDTSSTPRPTPRPSIPLAEAAVASARGYTVQFAAAGSEREARAVLRRLHLDSTLTPRIVPAVRNGKTLYRVVIGPFATRAQADRVGKASGHDYWIYEGAP